MTTYAERHKIEIDAQSDPASPPAGSTAQQVTDARAMLARVRQGLIDVAEEVLSAPAGDERTAWARNTITNLSRNNPLTVASPLSIEVLNILLARFSALTSAQVLAANDTAIHDALVAVMPVLSQGHKI